MDLPEQEKEFSHIYTYVFSHGICVVQFRKEEDFGGLADAPVERFTGIFPRANPGQ